MLEATVPIHMMVQMAAPVLLQGTIIYLAALCISLLLALPFLPFSLAMFCGSNIFGHLASEMGRRWCALSGLLVFSLSLFLVKTND